MKSVLFLAAALLVSNAFAGVVIKSNPSQGDVQFEATGKPSMLKIKGKGEGAVSNFKIQDGLLNGDTRFKLETLSTGIDMRDEHMKEKYLQVKEYPEAILTFKDYKVAADWSVKKPMVKNAELNATLKLHGVEKPVKGTFQIDNEKFTSHAEFDINLSDFNIDIPTYLGVKVADTVKVSVNFTSMDVTEVPNAATPVVAAPSAEAKKVEKKKKK